MMSNLLENYMEGEQGLHKASKEQERALISLKAYLDTEQCPHKSYKEQTKSMQ